MNRLLFTFALGLASVASSTTAHAQKELYVAAEVTALGDGSRQTPFATLVEARDAIRQARTSGDLQADDTVTVWIGPGIYQLEKSFELSAVDSGTEKASIVYRATKTGTARIRGGITLDPNAFKPITDPKVRSRLDESIRDQIRVCDLSKQLRDPIDPLKTSYRGVPESPWLYCNDQPMTLARWPNVDAADGAWATFSTTLDTGLADPDAEDPAKRKARGGSFVFEDPRPQRWNLDAGVWLLGYWTHDWSDEVIRIASYEPENHQITLAAPHNYGINAGTWGAAERRFFALNALEELDAPGEWYLDRTKKRLYFYPNDDLIQSNIVLATLTRPLVQASNLKHTKFEGLVFEYAHADGIVLHNTEHVEITGCRAANLAKSGFVVDGNHNTIRSCDLYNLGTSGLSLRGGDRRSLTPAENLAINNHIHHYGLFQRTYAPGIGVSGCGQSVQHNCIHDAPHNAVLYGGNEHRFEYNEVYRVVMETGDAGAFYTGRDWTSQGNVLRHNYIHDLGGGDAKHVNTMGVYLDDCDSGDTIEGNVFYRAGRAIMIGGGRSNPVLNNLVIDCPIGLHIDARGMTWKQWNNPSYSSWHLEAKAQAVGYTQPPWSDRYPKLAAIMNDSPRQPLYNPIRRNVFVDCTSQVCNFDGNVKKLLDQFEIENNLVVQTAGESSGVVATKEIQGFTHLAGTADDPIELGFKNEDAENFSLTNDARLLKVLPSFEPIPFAKIGLYRDQYREQTTPTPSSR
ncbi:right-handed parallel beta-helix repeat-containing protein [Novipirellula artificiosorum]|uniref:Right handed beta helix domain-containing protein n=1 Tax=Novipirellula artificiosorum TaxID=2528016 RepID=A0A5C6E015_9BACT|nr:right-handed parallel beta-helix repeat-containing protein [Novipirellula artificiosorum]TWU42055.1 hypothetical protein Poly41_03510 [Novipirellula artificiosorum]